MSRRALASTAAVVLLLAAVAAVFAAAGWPWSIYVGLLVSIVVFAWVAYMVDDMAGRHAIDDDDWVAYVIADMERHLVSGDAAEDFAAATARPVEPPDATPPRRGVLGRIVERLRRIDWSDDRGQQLASRPATQASQPIGIRTEGAGAGGATGSPDQ